MSIFYETNYSLWYWAGVKLCYSVAKSSRAEDEDGWRDGGIFTIFSAVLVAGMCECGVAESCCSGCYVVGFNHAGICLFLFLIIFTDGLTTRLLADGL